jgi:hypothetical protein
MEGKEPELKFAVPEGSHVTLSDSDRALIALLSFDVVLKFLLQLGVIPPQGRSQTLQEASSPTSVLQQFLDVAQPITLHEEFSGQ